MNSENQRTATALLWDNQAVDYHFFCHLVSGGSARVRAPSIAVGPPARIRACPNTRPTNRIFRQHTGRQAPAWSTERLASVPSPVT